MGGSVPECRAFYLPVSHVTHENIRFRNAIGGMFRIDEGCPVVPVFSGGEEVWMTVSVDEEELQKLHLKCLDEVKRINGAVKFERAYKYQKRET